MPLVLTLIILNTNTVKVLGYASEGLGYASCVNTNHLNTVKVLGYASEDLGYASCVNTNHFEHLPTESIKLLALAL